jgi:diguanylate cyclase (GGDEF)-like protein
MLGTMPMKDIENAGASAPLTPEQLRLALRQTREEVRALRQTNQQLLQASLSAHTSATLAVAELAAMTLSSQRDVLTNTPNRALLLDRLQRAITMAQRRSVRCAVVFVDIDHFKQVNDTLGHATGDGVLQMVAHRLETAVRDSDAVGRHGGDEFLVLLAEVSHMTDAVHIAKKLISDIAAPSLVCGHLLQVSVSVGLAIYPDDATDAAALIALADTAMYRAKRRGGGRYCFHGDPHPGDAGAPTLGY